MNIAERLKYLRLQKGLTGTQAADGIGVKYPRYYHYEKGDRIPKDDFLDLAATYYDVSSDYLLGRTNNPSPYPSPDKIGIIDIKKDQFCKELYDLCLKLDTDDRNRLIGYTRALLDDDKYKKTPELENLAG